jgi:oligoendopeptidase F
MGVGRNSLYNLTNTDSYLGYIKDEEGKDVLLTETNYTHLLQSKNKRVRKDAFNKYYEFYEKHKNTISTFYASQVKQDEVLSKIRKYPNSLEASLFSDNINIDVYNSLINNMHNNLDIMDKFMSIKAKLNNVDKLHMYDIYLNPLSSDTKYSFEESKKIVFDALKILGKDYLDHLARPFDEKWIDVYPSKGKKSGAYQWSVYKKPTYVLLNHNDDLESVYTMAHELGHAMHSLYSYEGQDFINHDYPIFLAEIASTTNEVLLTEYFLNKCKDDNEKKHILVKFLDEVRTTIFRQTMFAEFEKIVHECERKHISLTEEKISSIYYKLNKKYYGNHVISDKNIRFEWERIPHFYTPFYVYKYATGMISAICIASKILEDNKYASIYKEKFLSAGGSDYPLNILKNIGIDMTTDKPYKIAFKYIEDKLKELNKLMK